MRRSLIAILLSFVLLDCRSVPEAEPETYQVPAEVEPYVKKFREEASRRGKTQAITNLIVTFGTLQGEEACGECVLAPGRTPRITLSSNTFCWKTLPNDVREALVFHELGHCVLKRGHKTTRLPNGAYASLMSGKDIEVYATCIYPINGDASCDLSYRRAYYIDELFDENTPVPVWGR